MRRAVLWGVGAGVLAVLIWVVEARSFFRPLLAVAPVVVYAVVLLVRVVMEPVGERSALIPLASVRRAARDDESTAAQPSGPRPTTPPLAAGAVLPARHASPVLPAVAALGSDELGARTELEDALGRVPPD